MKTFFTLLCLIPSLLAFSSENLDKYLDYLHKYPQTMGNLGNAQLGEIELVIDKEQIAEIEKIANRTVGIVAEDKYWIWVRDAVKFPNGTCGVYGRIIWRCALNGIGDVAIMPITEDGKVFLNINYRHASRSWELELPSGLREEGESLEDTAHRELKEETGFIADELQYLGEMLTDPGASNGGIAVFIAKIVKKESHEREDSEAIASVDAFSIDELKQGFIDGYFMKEINGELQKVSVRSSILTFALFQAEIKGLYPQL